MKNTILWLKKFRKSAEKTLVHTSRAQLYLTLILLAPSILFSAEAAPTPHVISFFMAPCAVNPTCAKKFHEDIKNLAGSHTEIAQEILKHHLVSPLVQGIYVAYKGYITYTDYNGQIMLPNKESSPELTVLVTSQIYPVMHRAQTVSHFEIPEETDAHFYHYALHHDEKNKKWLWNITQIARPTDSRVPQNALIILAKPKDIEITPGTFPALAGGPHFHLPDMYVHTGIDTPFCVLKFLKVNRFFEPLVIEKKYQEQSFSQAVRS